MTRTSANQGTAHLELYILHEFHCIIIATVILLTVSIFLSAHSAPCTVFRASAVYHNDFDDHSQCFEGTSNKKSQQASYVSFMKQMFKVNNLLCNEVSDCSPNK